MQQNSTTSRGPKALLNNLSIVKLIFKVFVLAVIENSVENILLANKHRVLNFICWSNYNVNWYIYEIFYFALIHDR